MKRSELEKNMNQLTDIYKKYNIGGENSVRVQALIEELREFKVRVLFVGCFSAGKSALLNKFIGKDILKENQNRETAIATEIVYDYEDYAELIRKDKSTQIDLENIKDYDVRDYDFYRYHINSESVLNLKDIILVDMPGINSGINEHNKAIFRYVDKGSGYVVLIDCEDGDLKPNVIKFLEEVNMYHDNIVIVISKTDKKIESDVREIAKRVKETAEDVLYKDVPVYTSSIYNDDNDFDGLLGNFNAEELLEQVFESRIEEARELCAITLKSMLTNLTVDTGEIENEIYERQKAKIILNEKLAKEKEKLNLDIKNNVKPLILADVRNALSISAEKIAMSILNNGDTDRIINDILRPILINSTKKYTQKTFAEFVNDMDIDSLISDKWNKQTTNDISDKYYKAKGSLSKLSETIDKGNKLYKTIVGGISIATSVVAPWIELIILFLPDILNIFGGIAESSRKEEVKNKVRMEVIPSIVMKLEEEVDKSLGELAEELIDEMEEKIGKYIEVEEEGLKLALERKAEKESSYNELIENIEKDIAYLSEAIEGANDEK